MHVGSVLESDSDSALSSDRNEDGVLKACILILIHKQEK